MDSSSKRPVSVIAAAVIAILGSLGALLTTSLGFFVTLMKAVPSAPMEAPPFLRTLTMVMLALMMCLSIFGVATGIGLIFLRNWARISTLICAGFFVFFGVIGIPVVFFISLTPPPNAPELPPGSMEAVRWILLIVYGLPLIIGIWWLILFNRKAVKAQFEGAATAMDIGRPQKPRCPLPIAVLAWFYLTSILNLLFLPFLPIRFPVFVFGQVLSAKVGLAVLILTSLGFLVAGVGVLKLKPWSYSLMIGLQVFWLASTAVSLLTPGYGAAMDSFTKEMQAWLHLPETQFPPADFSHHYGWMMALGLVFAGAILGLLVYYRQRFLEAASAEASSS
jgi:hypothetical protein